jgi:hypothetical protein
VETPRRSASRDTALALVAFAATLVLLGGAFALLTGRVAVAPRSPSPSTAGPSTLAIPSLGSSAVPSPDGVATFPPTPGPSAQASDPRLDPTIVGAGDIGLCSEGTAGTGSAGTADLIEGIAGIVFTAGDQAYDKGTADQYRRCYDPTWGAFKARTLLPAPGNHDWLTPNAAGYRGYFGALATPNGTTWYSRDVGPWHVIVLDSNCDEVGGCGPTSEQGHWLAEDLAKSGGTPCTLAIFHHPRFSSGEHGNIEAVAPIWAALYRAGVDVVVNGHDHDYERFAPQDPSGRQDRDHGIREFVVGTGGGEIRQFRRTVANSEFRLAGLYGVIEMRLHRTSYDWAFDPVGASVADIGNGPCH